MSTNNRITEHHGRSLAKSLTFRILVVSSDTIVIYLLTHRLDITLEVMVATNLASTLLYYLHERVWNQISWGRKPS